MSGARETFLDHVPVRRHPERTGEDAMEVIWGEAGVARRRFHVRAFVEMDVEPGFGAAYPAEKLVACGGFQRGNGGGSLALIGYQLRMSSAMA